MLKYDIDSIKYPAIYDNKLGIENRQQWEKIEFDYTQQRIAKLCKNSKTVKQTFDGKHLQALHKYIFQDCYDWAGKLRDNGGQTSPLSWHKTKEIEGQNITSIYTPDSFIARRLPEISEIIQKSNAKNPSRDETLTLVAKLSDRINEIHAFREGNSRTKRLFIKQVSEKCGYDMDFSKIDLKTLTVKEFVINSVFVDGKDMSYSDKDRIKMLKDLYSPIISQHKNTSYSSQLQKLKLEAPRKKSISKQKANSSFQGME